MPQFSERSKQRLATCDERLQRVFNEVIRWHNCTVVCGHRNEEEQNEAYRTGHSNLLWPRSKHNAQPSLAVDVIPYPVNWADRDRFVFFAGFVLGAARQMGIKLRWGGDWTMDGDLHNDSFVDMPHFELVD